MTDLIQENTARIARLVDLSPLLGKSVCIYGATGLIGRHMLATAKEAGASWATEFENETDDIFDFAIHCAGYGQPDKFTAEPLDTIWVNTRDLLKFGMKVKQEGALLFCSTSELYSGVWSMEHDEGHLGTTKPDHPRGCYIESKRCGEAIIHAFRSHQLKAHAARIALTYGPGVKADDSRVLNQFIQQALTTGRIEMRDEGLATRCYIYIADACAMLWNILLYGKQAIYNVGGTEHVAIWELAEMIARLTNTKMEGKEHRAEKKLGSMSGAPDHVKLNTDRYNEELGEIDLMGMEEGLTRTIEWYRSIL